MKCKEQRKEKILQEAHIKESIEDLQKYKVLAKIREDDLQARGTWSVILL